MRMKGETSSNLLPTTPPALVPTCQILYIGFLMWAIIHESPRAEMWTPYLEGLNQNSLKWELSLLPTNYPLFVVNQLAKSSEVKKKCTSCCLWLTEAECLLQWQSLWNNYVLGMSDFSHLICFYPRLPSWSTGPQNWDITFPTFLPSLLLVLHYLLRSWVHLGFISSWGQTLQGLPHSQELAFYKGVKDSYPCNSTTRLLIRIEMKTQKLNWGKVFPRFEVQRSIHHFLLFVFFLLCVMANADQLCVSIRTILLVSNRRLNSQDSPNLHHTIAQSRAKLGCPK